MPITSSTSILPLPFLAIVGTIGGMIPVVASVDYSWVNSPVATLISLVLGCTWLAFEMRQAKAKNEEWMKKFIEQNERVTLAVERSTVAIEASSNTCNEVKKVLEKCHTHNHRS